MNSTASVSGSESSVACSVLSRIESGTIRTTCQACDEPTVGSKQWCSNHRRAYECIERQCMKNARPDKEGHAVDNPQSLAFKTIFGWAPRSSKKRPLYGDAAKSYPSDPELACKVLCDFNSKFPDGEKDLEKKPTGRN